ncbi:polysaccharide deacetylase family protein [Lacticigenium naphthae]|uniref:polysaccharide deacetylase family protein n=1 Tax=Lacticigenium naphthae TaxID=515351 RepID=UPI0004030056|nr:polysaccharide deacetylase family protein [Lacticigenium naphthae]
MKKKWLAPFFPLAALTLIACQPIESKELSDSTSEAATINSEESSTAEVETVEAENEQEEIDEVTFNYVINPDTYSVHPIESGTNEKVVLLTFDDAPDGNAVEIATTLKEKDASAIFFVNSMFLESEQGKKDLVAIHEMGFEIGNHTHTHQSLPDLSETEQYDEIVKTNDIVEDIIGIRPRFFRAPFGMSTEYSKEIVKEEQMTLMKWSFGYDWEKEYQESAALTDITLNTPLLGNGANILMHDRTWTKEAIASIIDGLREAEFEIVNTKEIMSVKEGAE